MKLDDFDVIDFNQDIPEEEEELLEEIEEEFENFDWKKELFSWIYTIAITIVAILLLKNFVIINASVPTGSMENTIMPGDNLFGYRLAYLTEAPERGDVIFFYFPDDESQKYVKRIIGLPGETVYIYEGEIYIDGASVPLEETYLKEEWTVGTGPYVFEVPENAYFVLGDNRNTSQDARYWVNSYVTKDKIIGKALFTYFPISHWGVIE